MVQKTAYLKLCPRRTHESYFRACGWSETLRACVSQTKKGVKKGFPKIEGRSTEEAGRVPGGGEGGGRKEAELGRGHARSLALCKHPQCTHQSRNRQINRRRTNRAQGGAGKYRKLKWRKLLNTHEQVSTNPASV